MPSLFTSGSTATLTGAISGCRRSTDALASFDLLLVVGVAHQREQRAAHAARGLDHVRHVALLLAVSKYSSFSPECLGVLGQVEVGAVGDALELAPAERVEVLDVARGRASSARARPARARAAAASRGSRPEPHVPVSRASIQCSYQRSSSSGGTKNSISICSNSRVRNTKLPGVISLRNDLPICAMPNGGLRRAYCEHVLEVEEDALRGLGPQVSGRRRRPPPGRSWS